MCFPRKASLGCYSGTRTWKAGLVVAYDRPALDPLACPVGSRLAAYRMINEILSVQARMADSSESFSPGWGED